LERRPNDDLERIYTVFVLIVQLFEKVPWLKDIASTQSEPPFQVVQAVAFLFFGVLTVRAAMPFHNDLPRPD
jgi:hypothetical protein